MFVIVPIAMIVNVIPTQQTLLGDNQATKTTQSATETLAMKEQ